MVKIFKFLHYINSVAFSDSYWMSVCLSHGSYCHGCKTSLDERCTSS